MVTSGYAVLAAFIGVVQLVAGMTSIGVGVRSVLLSRADSPECADRLEATTYLSALLAYLLLGLSLSSWAVLYLMLDSFVPQWPSAMCIYGVTLIGSGSRGIYSWLPRLVVFAQLMKPALVFATGAALVVYRFYRRQGTRALLPSVAHLLLATGVVASLDAGLELAYVAIPKYEDLPDTGCCSVSALGAEQPAIVGPERQQRLSVAYYVCHLLMLAMLAQQIRRPGRPASWRLLALVLMAAATLWVSLRFLIDVASPVVLHLPYHRCLYDLVPTAPETSLALALLLWGTFCTGWTFVLAQTTRGKAPAAALAGELRGWPAYALAGYLGSVVMISLELYLA